MKMKKHGFTLLELIIVLAIMALFFAISVPLFSRLTESTKLETAARSVTSALRTARGYAITKNADYYVFFDLTTGPHTYFISDVADGSIVIEKKYKLPTGIWFYYASGWEAPDPDPVPAPIGFTKGTHADAKAALFKSTGELDDEASNDTSVYVANGQGSGADWKKITVERTTGRVEVN